MIRVLEAQDRSFMQAVYRELLIIGRPFSVLQCHAKRVKSKLRKSTEKRDKSENTSVKSERQFGSSTEKRGRNGNISVKIERRSGPSTEEKDKSGNTSVKIER